QYVRWADPKRNREINQVAILVKDLKTNPYSSRHIVSAWNVADLGDMALPPCHMMYQLYCGEGDEFTLEAGYDGYIDMHMYQRSVDVMLGLPFNIASYALLLDMLARSCNRMPRWLHTSFGDA